MGSKLRKLRQQAGVAGYAYRKEERRRAKERERRGARMQQPEMRLDVAGTDAAAARAIAPEAPRVLGVDPPSKAEPRAGEQWHTYRPGAPRTKLGALLAFAMIAGLGGGVKGGDRGL